ncbi:hypothetical protein [Sulfitobacter sp.]|uniref:hypothetical protein n=1 Tax=Sulfitobacter sp. TaxID=1903071 RepID=UPI003EF9FC61
MALRKIKSALLLLVALTLTACDNAPPSELTETTPATDHSADKPKLGLLTSLPLYWPLGAEFGDIASGEAEAPWQRAVLERDHDLVLLDTLTPIPGLTPDAPETDPLAGLERLAVIQPRGLSPADNVALDNWVMAGGHLLLMLDPQLTGEYEAPLGDPRRPTDTALIPPVVPRWGLANSYSPELTDLRFEELSAGAVPILMGSDLRVVVVDDGENGCRTTENGLTARCDKVGLGTVTYIGDAAVFEHRELAGENGEAIAALLDYAFP